MTLSSVVNAVFVPKMLLVSDKLPETASLPRTVHHLEVAEVAGVPNSRIPTHVRSGSISRCPCHPLLASNKIDAYKVDLSEREGGVELLAATPKAAQAASKTSRT